MQSLSQIQLLRASFAFLLTLTLLLQYLLSTSSAISAALLLSQNRAVLLALSCCISAAAFFYHWRRRRPILLVDYSCFKPGCDRKCSLEAAEYFVRRSRRFSTTSEEFMRGIYVKSGLGDETYVPPFIFRNDYEAKFQSAVDEVQEGMFGTVDSLLRRTQIHPSQIDIVIVTCGMFSPCPSLASMVVNRFEMRPDVQTFNLSGMGCSSGVISIDTAAKLLNRDRTVRYALVVVTESISLNWYFGDNRSMLVTNCIFRLGTAAALLTNDPSRRPSAKMELVHSLRTHHGADDSAYCAAFQEEDAAGNVGVALTKDLIRVAGEGLRSHIRTLGPHVLPLSQLVSYLYGLAASRVASRKVRVPDFTTAFEHICVHTGGKAVIEKVAAVMDLSAAVTEPARMTLHRFGNTSSSLVFYELAYFDAKGRVKKGDKMWMLAFGTGFKVGSLVWRALNDSRLESDNPWNDCIHRYPLKTW